MLINLRSIEAFAGELDVKAAGTKATKKDERGRKGRKETLSSKRRDSEKYARPRTQLKTGTAKWC